MKNKGFLGRSRIGDTGGHKETAVPPASLMETRASVPQPVAEVDLEDPATKPPEVTPGRPVIAGSRRHTVLIRVPAETATRLARHLEQFPPLDRPATRRALVSASMRRLPEGLAALPNVTSAPMTAIRVDIRLTDAKLAGLLAAAAVAPFEPAATALARLLSPRFTEFLDQL